MNHFPLGGAFPRPPPDGFPVVLGKFGTAGAFDPPAVTGVEELPLLPTDLAMAFASCIS
jgi:hypothetical protein